MSDQNNNNNEYGSYDEYLRAKEEDDRKTEENIQHQKAQNKENAERYQNLLKERAEEKAENERKKEEEREKQELVEKYIRAKSAETWMLPVSIIAIIPLIYTVSLVFSLINRFAHPIIGAVIYFLVITNVLGKIVYKCNEGLFGKATKKGVIKWAILPLLISIIPIAWSFVSPNNLPYFISLTKDGFCETHMILACIYTAILGLVCLKLYTKEIDIIFSYGLYLGILLLITLFSVKIFNCTAIIISLLGIIYLLRKI